MLFETLRKAFKDWAAPTDGPQGALGPSGERELFTPTLGQEFIQAWHSLWGPVLVDKAEIERLRPVVLRSHRNQPKGQSGRGAITVLDDGWRPDHQPYGASPDELTGCRR